MRGFRSLTSLVVVALPLVALVGAGGAGCHHDQTQAAGDAPSASTSALAGGLSPEDAAKVLAKFGDHTITLGDFATALQEMPEYERLRYQSVDRRKELLKSMIDAQLLADEAKKQGLDKEPLVQEETRQILVSWMRGELSKSVGVATDIKPEEAHAYFDAHPEIFREPERRRISQIVTQTEATAKQAYDEAKAAPAAGWGDIVRKYSDDKPRMPPGARPPAGPEAAELAGDLGFVTAPDDTRAIPSARVTKEMRTQAFALKAIGDVTPPFKDDKGWHVLRLVSKTEPHDPTFTDVERTIRMRMMQERRTTAEQKLVDETRQQVKVEVDEAALQAVVQTLMMAPSASASGSASAAPSVSASHK